jgi:hypothetical protein
LHSGGSLSRGPSTRRKNIRSAQTDIQVPTDYTSTADTLLEGDGILFFFRPGSLKEAAETCPESEVSSAPIVNDSDFPLYRTGLVRRTTRISNGGDRGGLSRKHRHVDYLFEFSVMLLGIIVWQDSRCSRYNISCIQC